MNAINQRLLHSTALHRLFCSLAEDSCFSKTQPNNSKIWFSQNSENLLFVSEMIQNIRLFISATKLSSSWVCFLWQARDWKTSYEANRDWKTGIIFSLVTFQSLFCFIRAKQGMENWNRKLD